MSKGSGGGSAAGTVAGPGPKGLSFQTGPGRFVHYSELSDQVTDKDRRISAFKDGEEIGYVEYRITKGKIDVGVVFVKKEHRRQGVATAIYDQLRKKEPGKKFKVGPRSDQGQKFRKAYDARRKQK